LRQWPTGKAVKAVTSSRASASSAATTGKRGWSHDLVELLADRDRVGLGEYRGDRGEDHLGAAPRELPSEHVAQEVHSASLPRRPQKHRPDRALQALVGVGDDEADAGQATGPERAQEGVQKAPGFAVADRQAQHLAVAGPGHAGGDDDRLATRRRTVDGP
jgi:hypothetical protein